jgi:hypothetical protein
MTELERFADYILKVNKPGYDSAISRFNLAHLIQDFYRDTRAPKITGSGRWCDSVKHNYKAGYCEDCQP